MTKANIGLKDSSLKEVSKLLNQLLADEYVLYTKTRNYHWNVTGPHFHDLHKFFEAQYEELDDIIDDIAERVRALGEISGGSLGEFLKLTRLKEQRGQLLASGKMLQDLLSNHEALIKTLRKDLDVCASKYQDMGTSDFLTGLMEQHEKMAWMIRVMNPSRS